MASSVNDIVQKLDSLSIKPLATLRHAETSPATWKDVLMATGSAPASFESIKTLVYKPKTAKTAVPVPVVVIAREETETSSGAIGKKLNLKDLRLASEDLLTDFFKLDKNSCKLRKTRQFPSAFNDQGTGRSISTVDHRICLFAGGHGFRFNDRFIVLCLRPPCELFQ